MTCTFTEPTLDDLLADPLVQMVMRSDGLSRGFVRELMETARQPWRGRKGSDPMYICLGRLKITNGVERSDPLFDIIGQDGETRP